MLEALKHPVRTFRTAPILIAGVSLNITAATGLEYIVPEVGGPLEIARAGAVLGNLALAFSGTILTNRQFALRNRLEEILDKNGFDERAFSTTTAEWCTRQVARVACEKYECLDEYEVLTERNVAEAEFSWLPHI